MPAQSPTLSPDVVGDRRGVARVVLGDPLLHLADEVRAHVGRLREDAAADPHEHREQRAAEPEAHQHAGGVALVDDQDGHGAEQTEPDREHAGHAAGAERDPHRLLEAGLTGRVGRADVGPHREPHADVARDRREEGAQDEGDRAAEPDRCLGVRRVLRDRQHEEDDDGQHDEEHGHRAELAGEVGARALLDRLGDLLHLVGALGGAQDIAHEVPGEQQRDEGDAEDHPQRGVFERAEDRLDRSPLLGKPADHRTSSVENVVRTGTSPARGPVKDTGPRVP